MKFNTITMTALGILVLASDFSFASTGAPPMEEKAQLGWFDQSSVDPNVYREKLMYGGIPLTLETGRIAPQADGSVLVRYEGTVVLVTVDIGKKSTLGAAFNPLRVNYRDAFHTSDVMEMEGKFSERALSPSKHEELVAHQIDRSIRPLLLDDFGQSIQVTISVLSGDENRDVAALLGASAALKLSGIPIRGPFGAARVAMIDGEYVLNPEREEMKRASLDLLVIGTRNDVVLVGGTANELPEKTVLEAIAHGQRELRGSIEAIERLSQKAGRNPELKHYTSDAREFEKIKKSVHHHGAHELKAAVAEPNLKRRIALLDASYEKLKSDHSFKEVPSFVFERAFQGAYKDTLQDQIFKGKRSDGRKLAELRYITGETGLFPRAQGSAFFTRGENQVVVGVAYWQSKYLQTMDALTGSNRNHFIFQYNVPPFSGEEVDVEHLEAFGRRDIAGEMFIKNAFYHVLPSPEEFPYSVRVTSEITGYDDGFDPSVTISGTSLAMKDAGVPLKNPVAGIGMGILKRGEKFVILSGVSGEEAQAADMKIKIAGTRDGITALQMDVKTPGIRPEIIKKAFEQGREGRLHILDEMAKIKKSEHKDLIVPEDHISQEKASEEDDLAEARRPLEERKERRPDPKA